MRKIVVNDKTYQYKVGESYTVVRGEGLRLVVNHHQMTGLRDIDRAKYKKYLHVTPSMVEEQIREQL